MSENAQTPVQHDDGRSDHAGGRTAVAAGVLVLFGILVLAAAVVGVRREAGQATAPSWTVLHLVILLALAVSLLRGHAWAWWGAVALVTVELFLLLPLIAALVGGPGITLLVPRLDLVLVAAEGVTLMVLFGLLIGIRKRMS